MNNFHSTQHSPLQQGPTRKRSANARAGGCRNGATNVLVIALDATSPLTSTDECVLVIAPVLNSRLHHWFSDDDDARRAAQERLDAYRARLACAGVHANGQIGDADPVQAIADALPTFAADEIVIAAHDDRSRRLAEAITARARKRFGLPITAARERLPRAA